MKKKLRYKLLIGLATTVLLSSVVAPALQPLKVQAETIVDSPSNHQLESLLKAIVRKLENFAPRASNITINPERGYPVENPERDTHALVTPKDIELVTNVAIQQLRGQSIIREITAPPQGVVFSGDWHGNLQDLVKFIQDVMASGKLLVFTGDCIDRGLYSVEVATLLLAMQALFPDRIVYIRGDHEDAGVNGNYGLYAECEAKYLRLEPSDQVPADLVSADHVPDESLKQANEQVFTRLNHAFDHLPMAAVISSVDGRRKSFAVHGGVSREMDLNVLRQIPVPVTDTSTFYDNPPETEDGEIYRRWENESNQRRKQWQQLHQLLWNDMDPNAGHRGDSDAHVCSKEEADAFCDKNEITDIFSGHLHIDEASGFRAYGDAHKYYVTTSSKYNEVGKFLTSGNTNYSKINPVDNNFDGILATRNRYGGKVSLLKAAVTFADGNLENVQGVDLENVVAAFIASEQPPADLVPAKSEAKYFRLTPSDQVPAVIPALVKSVDAPNACDRAESQIIAIPMRIAGSTGSEHFIVEVDKNQTFEEFKAECMEALKIPPDDPVQLFEIYYSKSPGHYMQRKVEDMRKTIGERFVPLLKTDPYCWITVVTNSGKAIRQARPQ
ncbi:MAG: metallophosphoesterase [Streptococcaceae bacterium]|nr:metallophosphoesterase [Streptococcaceae bacterium]